VQWADLVLAPLDGELVSPAHCFFRFSGEVIKWRGHMGLSGKYQGLVARV